MKRLFPLLAVLAFAQCGDDPTDPGVSTFITQITGGGATATIQSGAPPAAAGFPAVQIIGPTTVTAGGQVQYELHASGPTFNRVYVQINGMARYYQLNVPAAVATLTITIDLASTISVPNFEFVFGLGAPAGQSYASRSVGVN